MTKYYFVLGFKRRMTTPHSGGKLVFAIAILNSTYFVVDVCGLPLMLRESTEENLILYSQH